MVDILTQANLNTKKNSYFKNESTPHYCTVYSSTNGLQIDFNSIGCRNSYSGSCIMCDYGRTKNLNPNQVKCAWEYAISQSDNNTNNVMVNTYGSILDTFEFSEECLITLLELLSNSNFKNIIIETHYKTITNEKLELIQKYLKDKNVFFELGIETFNEKYSEKCLNKDLNVLELMQTIKLIQNKGFFVEGNFIIGMPFIDTKTQYQDIINNIEIAAKLDLEDIVLFPINIKKNTLLYELNANGYYNPISYWLIIDVLNHLPEEHLKKIIFAWYGNRELDYDKGTTIFPKSCDNCKNKFVKFFEEFNGADIETKKFLLQKITETKNDCDCYKEYQDDLNTHFSYEEKIDEVEMYLNQKLNQETFIPSQKEKVLVKSINK